MLISVPSLQIEWLRQTLVAARELSEIVSPDTWFPSRTRVAGLLTVEEVLYASALHPGDLAARVLAAEGVLALHESHECPPFLCPTLHAVLLGWRAWPGFQEGWILPPVLPS